MNLVSFMEEKCFVIMFQKRKVLICTKGYSPYTSDFIRVRYGNIYRLQGKSIQALVHSNDNLSDIRNIRMGSPHYKGLSIMREIVTSLPEFSIKQ